MASTPSDKDRPNVSLTRAQVSDRLNAMSEALRGVVEGGSRQLHRHPRRPQRNRSQDTLRCCVSDWPYADGLHR